MEQPLQIVAYEFLQDAMGAGKHRGGAPFRRDYRMCEEEGIIQVRNDRCAFQPYGLYGGRPGRLGRNLLNPDADNEPLPGKLTRKTAAGVAVVEYVDAARNPTLPDGIRASKEMLLGGR